MRILHMIGRLEMGGSQTMVMSLYRAIDRSKVQFDFVVDCDEENVFEQEIAQLGGRVFRLPKFNGKNFMEVRKAWAAFFKTHPEYKVLHSHIRSYAAIYLPVAKAHGVKTIIHSHNTSNGHGIMAIGKKLLQYPLRFQADYYFGCSEIAGQWLFGKKIVASDRYYMLKNAVDLDRFSYKQQIREKIRRQLNIKDDALVIGHIGRMHPQKNHHFLIDCFAEIAAQREDARLILLGDGDLRAEITEQIHRLVLDDKVLLLGIRKNIEEYLCAMDCMALPSLHEGLPVVVVEAQANGLHCFVADTVTKEVELSELVRYLPISQGSEPWVQAILNCKQEHINVSRQIQEGGFCVSTSSRWLCDFYQAIVKEKASQVVV